MHFTAPWQLPVHCDADADADADKDLFIGPQEFVVGYSKAPEQPQNSARHICHSLTMMSSGREPATICIAAYRGSLHYALCHGRRPSRCRCTMQMHYGVIKWCYK